MSALRGFATLVLAALLAGCASVPLSTALHFSSWGVRDFAQVDPAKLRIRLSVDEGFEVDVPGTRLAISLTDADGLTREAKLPLHQLLSEHGTRPGGWFARDVPVNTLVLALAPEGARRLADLQKSMLTGHPRAFDIDISARLARMPPEARRMTFWADLKLGADQPWIALIDGADFEFEYEQ